jgi:hypothetical protein
VTELKVSANLMTLDTGLFCIFNAPGSPLPDPASGLPGVRVSVPTGPLFRPEAITITGFRDDGWLGGWNGAALVRVTRGPAQILVTIYQAPNSTAEPPRLQILRLAEAGALPPLAGRPAGAAAPAAAPQPAANIQQPAAAAPVAARPPEAPAASNKSGEIVAHVQGRGDVTTSLDDWMGEPGSKRWVEGFSVSPKGPVGPGDIEYQAVLGRGWLSPWAEGGQYCGSRGMSLPILGLRMRLRGDAADRFDCILQASFVDGTEIGPTDDGEPCQAESLAPLEAFRIKLVPRGAAEKPEATPPKTASSRKTAAEPAKSKPKAAPALVARKAPPTPVKPPTRKR